MVTLAVGLAELLALVWPAALAFFSGALVAGFAGGGTAARFASAGLLEGLAGAGTAGGAGTWGAAATVDACLTDAGIATFTEGAGAG